MEPFSSVSYNDIIFRTSINFLACPLHQAGVAHFNFSHTIITLESGYSPFNRAHGSRGLEYESPRHQGNR